MLKGFVSGEEKDIKRIPMKGKNLFDKSQTTGIIVSRYINQQGTLISDQYYYVSYPIRLTIGGTYTWSFGSGVIAHTSPTVGFYDSEDNLLSVATHGSSIVHFSFTVPEGCAYIRASVYNREPVHPFEPMLISGTVPQADNIPIPWYEPYGYQEGWEVRDNQDRLIWGREDELQTATGTLPFKGYGLPVKVKSLLGNAVQNGTPAPDNIITPEMCGKLVGYDWTIPLTNAGQTISVYLGEVPTVRRIRKLVLTGTETIAGSAVTGGWVVTIYPSTSTAVNTADFITAFCSHYKSVGNTGIADLSNGEMCVSLSRDTWLLFVTDHSTKEDFAQFLADEYAAGHPVTVWYVLATEQTAIVNEPLAKIGDYADELNSTVSTLPEIPTTTGENTLTVDTNLAPSSLTVEVHAKKIHYGFKIDKSNDDSNSAVTYTHDAVTMTPAHMDFTNDRFDYGSWGNAFFVRDCYPVALNLDGNIAYRLDPDDYTKKMDGTPSDIFYELLTAEPSDWSTQWKQYYTKSGDEYVLNDQGSAPTFAQDTYYKLTYNASFTGNFMMAFPKVWFYRHEDSQYNYIEISNYKLSDDWKCYAHINASGQEVDFIYLPLFKGVIVNSKLRSLPGQIPQGNTTATDEVNAATALGSRWQIWDHSSVECINDLLTLMSKSIDSQGRFGKGRESGYNSSDTVTYGKLQTGTLIKGGKFHGFSSSYKEVKVFGIEGFWANRWERIQGMLLVDNVWKIKMTPPYNFTGTDFVTLSNAEVPSGNGYLSKVQTSEYGSIPASIANGSSTKYFKDYFYKIATDTRVALRGGACANGGTCGFRYVAVHNAASASDWYIGASPVFK